MLNIPCKNIIIVEIMIIIFGLILFFLNSISNVGLIGKIYIAFCMILGPIIIINNIENNSKRLNNGKIEKTIVEFDKNIIMNEEKYILSNA